MFIHWLRTLRGMERLFAGMIPVAIAADIFHFTSGRYGNALMVSVAIIVGATVLATTTRGRALPQKIVEADDRTDEERWFAWLEEHGDLDRPSDIPLPKPFQGLLEEINAREPVPPDDDRAGHRGDD